jgi:L-lactate dehydrogenase (cytochrome)
MTDTVLGNCRNIGEVEALARRRLPPPLFDYIIAGSATERTLRRNCDAFWDYEFRSKVGIDVSTVDTSTEFLGRRVSLPLAVAPTGGAGLLRENAELDLAKAAGKAGLPFFLSCVSVKRLEDVAKVCVGPKVFQIYPLSDKKFTLEMIDRARGAGYDAICLTIDNGATPGRPRSNRWDRSEHYGQGLPPLKTILAMATRPRTALYVRRQQKRGLIDIMRELQERGGTFEIRNDMGWGDWAELAAHWGGPFFLKGLLRGDDALSAAKLGPDGIVVCNHGGTYVDGSISTIDATVEIAEALPASIATIQCGGIRTGLNLAASLSLGAKLGMTGRPFLHGVAAAGEEGVEKVIEIFRHEFTTAMKMLGCRNVAEIDRSLIRMPSERRPAA